MQQHIAVQARQRQSFVTFPHWRTRWLVEVGLFGLAVGEGG